MSLIDTATNEAVGTPIPVLANPGNIAITPDGKRDLVGSETVADITVIDTQANQVVKAIPIPGGPYKLAIAPNQSPTASFGASLSKATTRVKFDGSATDPDGTLSIFNWGFGDGAVAANVGATRSHVYRKGGKFTASLAKLRTKVPVGGKAALKQSLASEGQAKTRVRVSLRPTGGTARSKAKSIQLILN